MGLGLHDQGHIGQIIARRAPLQDGIEDVLLCVLGREGFDDFTQILRQPVPCPAEGVVALLLLVALEFLIGIANQADIDQLGPVGVLGTLAAHVDNAVSEGAPVLGYHGDAAALEGLQLSVSRRDHIICDPGKQTAAIHTAAGLNGFDDRHNSGVIAWPGNDNIQVSDMFVTIFQIGDSGILVDVENAVLKSVPLTQLDVFDIQISDIQFHLMYHSSLSVLTFFNIQKARTE